jgi:purine-binding chemotaxis protein CheW
MIGYVMFRLADRHLACRLDEVREVLRLDALDTLPGLTPPISGVLELRGNPLPVVDLRAGDADARSTVRGDVLVMAAGVDAIGVVVDQVMAVLDEDALLPADDDRPSGLPGYVIEVRRLRDAATAPILLVDLRKLAAVTA